MTDIYEQSSVGAYEESSAGALSHRRPCPQTEMRGTDGMAKAILLLSGGLDSTLTGKLLLEMGIQVEAINFVSPFCRCTPRSLGCSAAKRSAEQLGITVRVFTCGADYLEVIKHPRFGRGSGMNPCLDCRIYMFSRAGAYMTESGADFVATGEVLGERPMSQRRQAMDTIERESGLTGLVLRPLCAKLLPPTIPEWEGVVDRDRLKAIQGRSRKPQIQLADELGIKDYLCPAGGCLLTDPGFSARFRDLLEHDPDFGMDDAHLLRLGRHFRLPSGRKVVVGRNEGENNIIQRSTRMDDVLLVPQSVPGPSVLCRKPSGADDVTLAAGLLAAYTKGGVIVDVEVKDSHDGGNNRIFKSVNPLSRSTSAQWWVGAKHPQTVLR
jgi:tRNA U34 2-thiouridine synthase MnmA/TrmU